MLTHAHEDHFGALIDLWPKLRVPIYATPFTAALFAAKRLGEPWCAFLYDVWIEIAYEDHLRDLEKGLQQAIHCVLDTMYAKAPYTVLQRAMHIHPTVAEFIPSILGDLTPLPELASRSFAAA